MKDLIEYLVKNIVNHPDDVEITESKSETSDGKNSITYTIKVNPEELGLVIGKGGQTIRSIRNLVRLKAIKHSTYVDIKLAEEQL